METLTQSDIAKVDVRYIWISHEYQLNGGRTKCSECGLYLLGTFIHPLLKKEVSVCGFCDRMEKCADCGLYFNVKNVHPHKIYYPNKKLFMKYGMMAS